MKYLLFIIVLISFASCGNIYNETHIFIHRDRIGGVLVVSSKTITSTTSYCRGQMINVDGSIWICQN